MVPMATFITANIFLALVFILGSLHYDYINSHYWAWGVEVYERGAYNFYSCAFTYSDTLPGFIFMVINANLITVAVVSGVIQLIRKEFSKANALFNIIFSGILYVFGLAMSIILAANRYLDTGIPMVVMAFFYTFMVLIPLAYGIACLILNNIATRNEAKMAGTNYNLNDEPVSQPQRKVVTNNQWKCPNCGSINEDAFCSECGTKKPQETKVWYCPECGAKNDDMFCSECGTKRPE